MRMLIPVSWQYQNMRFVDGKALAATSIVRNGLLFDVLKCFHSPSPPSTTTPQPARRSSPAKPREICQSNGNLALQVPSHRQ